MWLAVFIAIGGARGPAPADLIRFGWAECPGGCPPVVAAKDRAMRWLGRVQASAGDVQWYGRGAEFRAAYADACRRADVWIAAAAATEAGGPHQAFWLARLRHLIGPARYQFGALPAPVPGEVPGLE